MRTALYALAALCSLTVSACSSSQSPRCQELCQQEARCVRELRPVEFPFDEAECIAACTVLDRDPQGRRIVDEHTTCVNAASSCEGILQCR